MPNCGLGEAISQIKLRTGKAMSFVMYSSVPALQRLRHRFLQPPDSSMNLHLSIKGVRRTGLICPARRGVDYVRRKKTTVETTAS